MAKTRFVSDSDVRRIDLGDGDWVEIAKRLSYDQVARINETDGSQTDQAFQILVVALKAWNFKDSDGNDVPVSEEAIRQLDMETISELSTAISEQMAVSPKGDQLSAE